MGYNPKFICELDITQSKFLTHQLIINDYTNQFKPQYICVKSLLKEGMKEEKNIIK